MSQCATRTSRPKRPSCGVPVIVCGVEQRRRHNNRFGASNLGSNIDFHQNAPMLSGAPEWPQPMSCRTPHFGQGSR